MSIYVAMHKVVDLEAKDGFVPLLVGAAQYKEKIPDNIKTDNSIEDNISNKNSNYCELTGLYWMWKNSEIKDDEIIGLCHYRRFFLKNIFSVKKDNYLDYNEIQKILNQYDIIIPKKRIDLTTIKDGFTNAPKKEDMEKVRIIIEKLYPEYINSYDQFLNQKSSHLYNMFIAKKEIMNEYFKWLFDILFELEKEVDLTNYNDYEARIYGFISERLFNVWLIQNKDKLKIKEKYVHNDIDTYFKFLRHEIVSYSRGMMYGK